MAGIYNVETANPEKMFEQAKYICAMTRLGNA